MVEKMNENGFKIDLAKLKKLSKNFGGKIKNLEKEIYEIAGEEFNIKSTQQLSKILFEKMKLPTKGLKKTPKGVISTKESELLKLQGEHEIIDKILEYRELTKMTSTYIDNLIPEIEKDENERLHYEILQMGTSTGRMSSKNPNIQNIPTGGDYGKEIRKVFIAEKNFELVSFDYSQIDLRIAAIISQDKKLLKAFENK
jgi:DNA polymerase-1